MSVGCFCTCSSDPTGPILKVVDPELTHVIGSDDYSDQLHV